MAKNENLQMFSYGVGMVPVWTDGAGAYSQSWWPAVQMAPQTTINKWKESSNSGPKDAVELKVHFCCENCIGKMQTAINQVDGVGSVDCNYTSGKVTVTGSAKPEQILAAAKKADSRAALVKKK